MTEFEAAELAASIMGNFLSSFTLILSIVTAYIVAAFVAGKRLTKIQLAIVDGCFVASFFVIGWLSFAMFGRSVSLVRTSTDTVPISLPLIDLEWVVLTLYFGLLAGSLTFMRNIRRTERADDT